MSPLGQFYRASSLRALRGKLALLYGLGVSDALLTLLLLQTGLFREVNFLLDKAVGNPAGFLGLKILLPGLLLGLLALRLGGATGRQLKIGNLPLSFAVSLYGLVNALHLFWLLLYLVLPGF